MLLFFWYKFPFCLPAVSMHSCRPRSFSYAASSVSGTVSLAKQVVKYTHIFQIIFEISPFLAILLTPHACMQYVHVCQCVCVLCVHAHACTCVCMVAEVCFDCQVLLLHQGYAPCSSSEKLIAHKRVHYYYNCIGNLMSETADLIFIMKYNDYKFSLANLDLILTQHDSVSDALWKCQIHGPPPPPPKKKKS